MTPIEIIALVFAIAIIVRTTVIFAYAKTWVTWIEKIAKKKSLLTAIALTLAVIVGYYVFAAMSIVNIVAAIVFGALLLALALLQHMETIAKKHKKHDAIDLLKQYWLALIMWVGLALWVLYTLFF